MNTRYTILRIIRGVGSKKNLKKKITTKSSTAHSMKVWEELTNIFNSKKRIRSLWNKITIYEYLYTIDVLNTKKHWFFLSTLHQFIIAIQHKRNFKSINSVFLRIQITVYANFQQKNKPRHNVYKCILHSYIITFLTMTAARPTKTIIF